MKSIPENLTENGLFRLCVVMGAVGLLAVYGSSMYITLEPVQIREIQESWTGRTVLIQGEIQNLSTSSGNSFFDISQGDNTIMAVDFDSSRDYSEGEANITGHIDIYEGELEVIVDRVEQSS